MSAISESATINVMLADYAAMDLTGVKANILGVGGNILPITPAGLTVRFSLVTQIHVPADACPAETALEIALRDSSGRIFELPGQVPQPVRYAVVLTISANPHRRRTGADELHRRDEHERGRFQQRHAHSSWRLCLACLSGRGRRSCRRLPVLRAQAGYDAGHRLMEVSRGLNISLPRSASRACEPGLSLMPFEQGRGTCVPRRI